MLERNKKQNKKAYYFTLDALFALALLVAVIALIPRTIIPAVEPQYKISYLQEDTLNVMSTIKTVEINNGEINRIINNAEYAAILNPDDTLIETVAKLWATDNDANATKILTSFFLNTFDETDNIEIRLVNGTNPSEPIVTWGVYPADPNKISDIVSSYSFISGVAKGQAITGNTARAFLQKKEKTKIAYFGGYIGDGNITARIDLPENITSIKNVTIEVATNVNTELFKVNETGRFLIRTINAAASEYNPTTVYLNADEMRYFVNGTNYLEFVSNSGLLSISGGYIKIVYETQNPEFPLTKKQYLHQVEGIINEYDSIFAPNTIESMNAQLHYKVDLDDEQEEANATIVLTIGNTVVYRNVTNEDVDDYTVILDNATLHGILKGYYNISNVTVPVRLGFEEIAGSTISGGNADVVLITDVSSSMDTYDVDGSCDSTTWETTPVSYEGSLGARNQQIDHSEEVCMYRRINLPPQSSISFRWRVDSQLNKDYLRFETAGGGSKISGSTDWAYYSEGLQQGLRAIRFCYTKDAALSVGNDSGYIDVINITDGSGNTIFYENFESGNLNGWSFSCHGERLGTAQEVDKIFVDTVLNTTGNQAGLTSYSTNISTRGSGVINWSHLTDNNQFLKNQIDTYDGIDYTCTSCGIKNATNILSTESTPGRFKGMLVMTDGQANSCIPGDVNGRCWGLIGGNGYNGLAGGEATNYSCYARNSTNNITVFAVGFGSAADIEQIKRIACWNCTACSNPSYCGYSAQDSCNNNPPCTWNTSTSQCTLPPTHQCWIQDVRGPDNTIVKCLDTRWAVSNNAEELKAIYEEFGKMFVGLGFAEQRVNLTGNFTSVLYNDSFIEYNYTFDPCKGKCFGITSEAWDENSLSRYGSVITYESSPFDNSFTTFSFGFGIPLDIAVTSYSGPKWTKNVSIDNTSGTYEVYELDNYSKAYRLLGDPFHVNIPTEFVAINANNIVRLNIANSTNISNASDSDKVIYTLLLLSNYSYSNITASAEGCLWTISYAGSSNPAIMRIPSTYQGSDRCYYSPDFLGSPEPFGYNCTNTSDSTGAPKNIIKDDAYAQATYMLFRNFLDKNPSDCILDLNVSQYYIGEMLLSSVPYLQNTRAEVISWR